VDRHGDRVVGDLPQPDRGSTKRPEPRAARERRPDLAPGDVVSIRTCGGGGYGPPRAREPELVLRDVLEGKVSPERAREVYGVAVADGGIDHAATEVLRA